MDWLFLLHQTVCGAIAAAGFGVLFNIGFRSLSWCAASGGLTLFVRTICLAHGWNLEASSFMAALTVGTAVHILRRLTDVSQNALDVVGCIPMVPGSLAAKAILGLLALTSADQAHSNEILLTAVANTLRVAFTIGALGTGLAIPTFLLRIRVTR